MNEINEKVKLGSELKEKRVGTYTFGAMLITIGISVLIMTFTKLDLARFLLMLWPLFLVALGIEILYLNSRKNIKVKIDFISILFTCIVLFCAAIFSLGNYVVNKIIYDKDIKSYIISQNTDNNCHENYIRYDETSEE